METLRVLVVDDEAGMRYSVMRALRTFEVHLPDIEGAVRFELDEAESGEAALALINESPPDLMLLDHKMSGISGVDLLERLRGREPAILTIMITAFATIETAVRATKSGAYDFIAKPFTPDELRETLRKAAVHLLVQRQARRLAREKRRVRFEFISVLGHELKSPLGAIESYLNLVRQKAAGDLVEGYLPMIDRCLVRASGMRKLIEDLLDVTRLESGEKRREFSEVDVVEAARAAIEGVRPAADARGIGIELACEGPLRMRADRGEIEIVLNNLVSNAVKYNRDGGRVDVRLTGADERVTIAVRDTGIGLSAEDAGRLFHEFARIKNENTRDIPGSGLGLSIIKKIADLYRGKVGVESDPNVGSTFSVSLRQAAEPASEDATAHGASLDR